MKNFIWIFLVLALGLLAYFFLKPAGVPISDLPQTNTPGGQPGGFPGNNPADNSSSTLPGGSPANTQAVPASSAFPNIDETKLGTAEDQRQLIEQLQVVLQRNDLKPDERREVQEMMNELKRRLGQK